MTLMRNRLKKIFNPSIDPINKIFVNSKNILQNLEYLQSLQSRSLIFPVLKSNAYWHGLVQVTKILKKTNIPYIAVDSFPEYQIVKKYSKKNILVLWETNLKNYKKFKLSRTAFCVYNIETIKYLVKLNKKIRIHLFLDTWMHREWVNQDELINILEFLKDYSKITIDWVMSHLHSADDISNDSIQSQINLFKKMYHSIVDYWHNPLWRHIWNSAWLFKIQDDFFNAYRPWLALYWYSPFQETDPYYKLTQKLKPALQIFSKITALHSISKGEWVSYNHNRLADKDSKTASIPFGYAEWLPRSASNKIYFKYKKNTYPQLWTICMNFCSMEVSNNASILDEVELISTDWENSISNLAKASNQIIYEILVWLDKNIRRQTI